MLKDRIPPVIETIISCYLLNQEAVSFEHAFAYLITYISMMLCSNRVKIVCPDAEIDTFPNVYFLLMSDSGSGKDKISRIIKNILMDFFRDDYRDMEETYKTGVNNKIKAYLESADGKRMTKAQQHEYRISNRPRSLYNVCVSSSSPEGVVALREEMKRAGFGCVFWKDDEISTTMKKYSYREDLIEMMKMAYDNGDTEGKQIKGNKLLEPTYNVPVTALLYGAVDSTSGADEFHRFMELGFARRLMVYYNRSDKEKIKRTVTAIKDDLQKAKEEKRIASSFLEEIYKRTKPDVRCEYGGNYELALSPEAFDRYLDYKETCQCAASKMSRRTASEIQIEQNNRYWKALKLAGIYQILNSDKKEISLKNMEDAIFTADHFAQFLGFLFRVETNTRGRMLYYCIKDNPSKTTTFFYSQSFYSKNKQSRKKQFEEDMAEVNEICAENSEMVYKNIKHPKHIEWSIVPRPQEFDTIDMMLSVKKDEETWKMLREQFGGIIDDYIRYNNI